MENTKGSPKSHDQLDDGNELSGSGNPVNTGTTLLVNGHLNREASLKEKLGRNNIKINGPASDEDGNSTVNGPASAGDSSIIMNGSTSPHGKTKWMNALPTTGESNIPPPDDVILDSGKIEENEEDVEEEGSPSKNVETDDSKKDTDTSKAVSFADELEVFDYCCEEARPRTVSFHTPLHLIDERSSSVYSNQEETHVSGPDSLSLQDKNSDLTEKEGSIEDDETQPVEDNPENKPTTAQRPSILSLFKTSSSPEISEEDQPANKEVATLETNLQEAGIGSEALARIVQFDDGTSHKEFTVELVDETDFRKENDEANERLIAENKGISTTEVDPLHERTLSTHSDGVSHSTDSNNWDTIGPLDNPAFLKTLQYSVSQPFDQDEHFGLQSNLDLQSLNAVQDKDLDGGWAWIVLVVAFIAAALLGATVYAAGVLMNAILKEIDHDLTKASWVGSVNVSVMCISGPFVGSALKRFGARVTVFFAGIVMFLGFIGASLSTTIGQLILTHGLIAGLGAGYTINPLFVSVGQYFNRYRGLACGLLATGAGAGMLTGGTAISALLDTYGLSGTYLIWAGVVSHIAPIGLLLRPSPEERLRTLEDKIIFAESQQELNSQQDLGSGQNSMISGLNSLFGSVNQSVVSGMDRLSQKRKFSNPRSHHKHSTTDPEALLLRSILQNEMSRSSYSVATNATSRSHQRSHTTNPAQPKPANSPGHSTQPLTSQSTSPAETPTATSPVAVPSVSQYTLSNNLSSSPQVGHTHHQSTSTLTPANATPSFAPSSPTSTRGPLSRFHRNRYSVSSQSQYTSMSHISRRLSFRSSLHPSHAGELDNESITSTLVSQLRPRDALAPRHPLGSRSISTLMGSIASFPVSLAIVKDDLSRYEVGSGTGPPGKSLKDCGIRILDSLRLLRNKPFLVFIFTCFLWAFGESPVMIYLPSYAISRGTSPMQASFLYTAMGIGSVTGRFLSGLIATDSSIGPIILHIGCLGVTGLLTVISPLITATVVEQMIFSCLLGLYTGSLVPLTSLITIDMLGIGELGLGFGFISMSQGLGYLIGPPLSSVIVQAIGYQKAFVFAGFVLLSGSIVAMSIALLLQNAGEDDEENQEQHSLMDLERMLRRIADSDSEEGDNDDLPADKPEDHVKNLVTSLSTLTEVRESQKSFQSDAVPLEGEGEATKHSEHYPVEEKLDPIMEVAGK